MKANEFVKKFGLEKAHEVVSGAPDEATHFYIVNNVYAKDIDQNWFFDGCLVTDFSIFDSEIWLADQLVNVPDDSFVNLDDLKRLIESHELVEIHGFEKSKEIIANAPSDEHFYSWTLGNSGVRDKTVNIGELRKAIADVESCQKLEGE